jgi:hypothetical protein
MLNLLSYLLLSSSASASLPETAAPTYPYRAYFLASPSAETLPPSTGVYGLDDGGALHRVVPETERLDVTLELAFTPDAQQLYALHYNKLTARCRLALIAPSGEVTIAPLDLGSQVRAMTIPLDGKLRLLRNNQIKTELLIVDPRAGFALTTIEIGGVWSVRDMTFDRAGNLYFSGGPVNSIGVYRIAPDLTVTKIAQPQPGVTAPFQPYGLHCDLRTNTLWIGDNLPSTQGRVFSLGLTSDNLKLYTTVSNFIQPSLRSINFDTESQLPVIGLHTFGLVGPLLPSGALRAPLSIKNVTDIDFRPQ